MTRIEQLEAEIDRWREILSRHDEERRYVELALHAAVHCINVNKNEIYLIQQTLVTTGSRAADEEHT